MDYSPTTIANMALAEISADPIASFDEASLEARECRRWYPIVVAELLAMHAWSWAKLRTVLAEIANDRPGEWSHAYAMPSSSVYPIRIVPNVNGPSAYQPLTGQLVATPFNPWSTDPLTIPYVLSGETLYTNQDAATLEYTSDVGMEPMFTPMFARALALELAARLCSAITKSRDKQGDLIKLAETARGRAIASDVNQSPQRYGQFLDEASIARGVGIDRVWPYGGIVTYQNGA